MPNYSLVVNSTFQPFTYQELMAPVQRLSDVHDLIAAQYDELSTKADVLEALGEKDRDSDSYSRYKAYSDQLRQEADALMREGLTASSKARLMGMRRDYNKIIVPIQNAWNKREEEAKEQRTLAISNPSIMFTRTAANTSIDHYVNNPTGGYGVINGNLIRTQMSDMAKNLAKQYEEGKISINDIDPYTRQIIERKGMTPDEINHWLRDPSAFPTLTNMRDQVLRANGVTPEALQGSSNADQIYQNSLGYANMGAWDAIGETSVKIGDNFINQLRAKEASEIRIAQRKYEIEHPDGGDGLLPDSEYSSGSQAELPMATADYSPAEDQENALKVLGYNKQKDGTLLFTDGKVDIKYTPVRESPEYINLAFKVKNYTATKEEREEFERLSKTAEREVKGAKDIEQGYNIKASLYGKDGRLMSKDEFVKQANGAKHKEKALREYYNKIEEAYETLGLSMEKDSPNLKHQEITAHYNKLRDQNAAQFAYVRALNYDKDAYNPTTRSFPVQKLKKYQRGKPVLDTKMIPFSDLLDNNDLSITPFWNEDGPEEGLILKVNDTKNHKSDRYFMSIKNMMNETNIMKASNLFKEAQEYGKINTLEAQQLAREKLDTAMIYLDLGLTTRNLPHNQHVTLPQATRSQYLKGENTNE